MTTQQIIAYIAAEIEWHKANRGTSGKSEDFEEGFISALKHIHYFAEGNYWLCDKCKMWNWKDDRKCQMCKPQPPGGK